MTNYDSDYEVRLATLEAMGGDITKHYDSVYDIDLEILRLTEQGGGGSDVINDNIISTDKTWSSNKINEEIQAVAGTANSDIEGKSTEDFKFVTELPQEAEEDEQVVIKGENADTLYKYVSGAWVEQTPDANILYFDTENEALYSYVTLEHQFAPVSLVNTIVVGSSLNSNVALKAIKTPGVYSVVQRLHSETKGDYIKNWTLTVEGVDYDEYERTDTVYQRVQSNYTIYKRTWSSTRATNDGWTSFSTYYTGEVKDSTTSKYYTWSSNKLTTELGAKQDSLTAGQNISIDENNAISADGYKYYPDIKSTKTIAKMTSSTLINKYSEDGNIIDLPSGKNEGFVFGSRNVLKAGLSTIMGNTNTIESSMSSNFTVGKGNTINGGNTAIAVGLGNTINGGNSSLVSLQYAIGNDLIVNNHTEGALGQYNINHNGNTDAAKTRFSIGDGKYRTAAEGDTIRENIIEVMNNGDIYLRGVGDYDGVHVKSETGYENTKTLQEYIAALDTHIEPDYLSFKNVGSDTVYVTFNAGNTTATGQFPVETGQYSVFQYSMNKKTWTNLTEGYIELNAGEVVYFRGILSGIETLTSSKAATFKTYTDATLSTFVSSGCLEVDGDLRSMVDYTGINDDIVPFRGCTRLFNNNAAILNTPKMTSSILKDFAYDSIFYNCVNLTYVKTFEFKTLVGQAQCNRMFQDCSSLTTAPELPSTQLAKRCYSNMFSGCINLKQAPELPSLLVPYDAYDYMFNGCTSLTIPPSTLPAMTIGDYAYYGMFKGCTSLKYTPDILVLSADNTNADDEIYYGSNHGRKMESMFDGCTSLSTIKLHNLRFFTSTNCVNKITNNVAANGTMYIASGSRTAWEAMAQGSGIPTGWTIIEI